MFGLLFIDFPSFFVCAFDVSSDRVFAMESGEERDVSVGVSNAFKPLNIRQALLFLID
jgi:hypothetical protein